MAIRARGLRRSYGDHVVLDGVDLDVEEGTIFALLGPNGAGKTTLVSILTTLIRADEGTARVAGHDVAREPGAVRAAIGVTGQFAAVDGLLTGEENLQLMADLHRLGRAEGRRRVADLLGRFASELDILFLGKEIHAGVEGLARLAGSLCGSAQARRGNE